MKKFLIITVVLTLIYYIFDYFVFYKGTVFLPHRGEITIYSKTEGDTMYQVQDDKAQVFEIKGVNLGLGKPGKFATEYAITKEEYLRWFKQIQEMGANTIRIYTLAHEAFYEAFYDYNKDNPDPLYLIHGVWVDDYLINASYSALDKAFYDPFLEECKAVIDAIHGRYKSSEFSQVGEQSYLKDISPWVYGYILGVEWEDTLVSYTNYSVDQLPQYEGEYFYTTDATNFEIFLAMIGDEIVAYETEKYGEQRAIAFSNWATTDPFTYPEKIEDYFLKTAHLDVENIRTTDTFLAGHFASYHIYPYYPNYHSYLENHQDNTYLQYLTELNDHHTIPVVISEFGVPSSRGMAAYEENLERNQGFMSEADQGHAIISMYEDIKQAGSAGAIVFTWQDEWFKRTWNTMANTDLDFTPYWSDYQTNEQYFGLLAFDPGKEKSICYVDGDRSDWSQEEPIVEQEGFQLSVKYDEKFIYFLVEKEGFDLYSDTLYIPIDTTTNSGSSFAKNLDVSMTHNADFIIEIDGANNSRVWVQERYDTTRALYPHLIYLDKHKMSYVPDKNSSQFNTIDLLVQKDDYYKVQEEGAFTQVDFQEFTQFNRNYNSTMQRYETGKLTYGNANPQSETFNSLADFCAEDGFVEIKIPWGLLNFADPSQMHIHDDYYEYYGIEYQHIDSMNIGVGDGKQCIEMSNFPLEKLGKDITYHERLKESYYILQAYWNKE